MHTHGGDDSAFLAVVALGQSITASGISLVTQVVAIDLEAVLVYVIAQESIDQGVSCLLYTSPSPRDVEESRMPSSA